MKTMIDVVMKLVEQGHSVRYYMRRDGGILIRSIDGRHFKGASGNIYARELTGTTISEARATQLKFATGTRKELRSPTLKGIDIPDPIWEEYKRVKRQWDKAFKAKGGKPSPVGYFTKARIKKALRDYGPEEAMRRISEAEKYATGIAYSKNVRQLADYILGTGHQLQSQELIKLAQDIMDNAYSIRDEWIYPAYNALYKINQGQDPKQVATNVRKILRL